MEKRSGIQVDTSVVYFDQLSGAARNRKLVETLCFEQKRLKTAEKKVFQPDFGCTQHPKAGRNTQHTSIIGFYNLCSAFARFHYHLKDESRVGTPIRQSW